jgi:hypothetical protein
MRELIADSTTPNIILRPGDLIELGEWF